MHHGLSVVCQRCEARKLDNLLLESQMDKGAFGNPVVFGSVDAQHHQKCLQKGIALVVVPFRRRNDIRRQLRKEPIEGIHEPNRKLVLSAIWRR